MGNLTHTVSGGIASFRSAARVPIESLKCHFLPVQEGSGDPSPENVRPINGWNNINITQCSFNLFNKNEDYSENNFYYKSDGTTVIDNNYRTTGYIKIKPSTTYFWAIDGIDGIITVGHSAPRVAFFDINKTWISSSEALVQGRSMISPSNAAYVRLPVYVREAAAVASAMFVEGNSMPTTYESYYGSTIPITFPNFSTNLFDSSNEILTGFVNSNGVYSNNSADTRTTAQFSIQSYSGQSTYLSTLCTYNFSNTGNISFSFIITEPSCNYIVFKHNGSVKDFRIKIPFNYGLGIYTVTCNIISNDPTTIGGLQISDIQIKHGGYGCVDYTNNILYGGYIDLITGDIIAEQASFTFKCSDTDQYDLKYTNTQRLRFATNIPLKGTGLTKAGITYCNKLVYNYTSNDIIHYYTTENNAKGYIYAYVPIDANDDDEYTFVVSLYTPQRVGTLTSQQLKTFIDYNNIWSNTNGITEVSYQIHDSNMIQQAKKNIMAENETHYRKVLWNNIADGNISDTDWKIYNTNNVTATFNDGIASCEVIDTTKIRYSAGIVMKTYPPVTQNNIYYASYMIKPEYQGSFGIEYAAGQQLDGTEIQCPANTWTRRSFITNGRIDANGAMYIPFPAGYPSGITPKFQIKSPIYINLTAMFGMDNEPTLAEFEHLCEINNINLTQAYTKNTGTEQIWCIPDHNTNEYTTVEWNQNAKPINSSNYTAYNSEHIAVTFEDDVLVSTWLTSGSSYSWSSCTNYSKRHTVGNYYYLQYEYYTDIDGYIGGGVGGAWTQCVKTQINQWTKYSTITQRLSSGNLDNYAAYVNFFSNTIVPQANNICKARNIIAIDLTQMFGAGNEPLTVEELQATCLKNNINLNEAQPYNTGTKMIWKV